LAEGDDGVVMGCEPTEGLVESPALQYSFLISTLAQWCGGRFWTASDRSKDALWP